MKAEDHIEAYEEYKETIFKWALRVRGLEKSQRIVGLNASRGTVELLSAYLHKKERVAGGFQLNHRWFKSERVGEKLPEFERKGEIVRKISELENLCEQLTYGSPKPVEKVSRALELFREIEDEINRMMKNG